MRHNSRVPSRAQMARHTRLAFCLWRPRAVFARIWRPAAQCNRGAPDRDADGSGHIAAAATRQEICRQQHGFGNAQRPISWRMRFDGSISSTQRQNPNQVASSSPGSHLTKAQIHCIHITWEYWAVRLSCVAASLIGS